MGTVVQFAERLSEGGDWTPAERSQLRDMGSQLAEAAAGLDLVFGKTEEGDPWAVVADQHSEVLLHIARIGGAFVVHAPANDQTVESSDLWNAVTRVVGGVLQRRRGLVLPFPPEAMGQQAVLALMVAAAVRGDFHELIQGVLPGAPTANDFTAAPLRTQTPTPNAPEQGQSPPDQAASAEARHAVVVAAAAQAVAANAAPQAQGQPVQEAAPAAAQAGPLDGSAQPQQVATVQPLPWARTAPEPGRVVASASAPTMTSTATSGGGDKGAPQPEAPPSTNNDFAATGAGQGGAEVASVRPAPSEGEQGAAAGPGVDSGTGSGGMGGGMQNHDIAVMAGGPIARGAVGSADNFMLNVPRSLPANAANGGASLSLGTVEGFSAAEGDRFLLSNGLAPNVTSVATLPEVTNMIPGAGPGGAGLGVAITGRRFGFDLNGDGREDAFVMVLSTGEVPVLHQAANTQIGEAVTPAGQAEASVSITTVGIFIGH